MKGRTVPIYRPGVNHAGEITIPSCNLTLPDGRVLSYRGRQAPISVGGGATLTLSGWLSADGLAVAASIDRLPHLVQSRATRHRRDPALATMHQ
jgi:hypothetical protein